MHNIKGEHIYSTHLQKFNRLIKKIFNNRDIFYIFHDKFTFVISTVYP